MLRQEQKLSTVAIAMCAISFAETNRFHRTHYRLLFHIWTDNLMVFLVIIHWNPLPNSSFVYQANMFLWFALRFSMLLLHICFQVFFCITNSSRHLNEIVFFFIFYTCNKYTTSNLFWIGCAVFTQIRFLWNQCGFFINCRAFIEAATHLFFFLLNYFAL